MTDEQRKRRAEVWQRFATEPGGLFEMLDDLRELNIRVLENGDNKFDELQWEILELRVIQDMRYRVQAIINTGTVDAAEQAAEARRATGEEKAFH